MGYLMALPITSNIHTIRISKKVTATPARKKLWNSFNIKWKLFHFIHYQRISLPPSSQEISDNANVFPEFISGGDTLRSLCFLQKTSNILSFFPYIYKAKTSTFLSPKTASQTFFHKKSFSWKRRTWTLSCQKFHFGYVFLSDWFWRDSTMGIHHHFFTTIWETIFFWELFRDIFFFGQKSAINEDFWLAFFHRFTQGSWVW